MSVDYHCKVWTDSKWQHLDFKQWFDLNEKLLHREDGPAIVFRDNSELWIFNGKRHRVDGPAFIMKSDGISKWYLNGKVLPEYAIIGWLADNNIDLSTEEGQMAFVLKWS